MSTMDGSMESDLNAWGKAIRLITTGRQSGRERGVTIGFLVEDDGSLLVAASAAEAGWAANLRADPACVVESDGQRWPCMAQPLDETERASAVAGLILKYGTPAERLGAGPAFRLVRRS